MNLLISPYAQKLRNGMPNPKTYPWWPQLIKKLEGHPIIQIGVKGEHPLVRDYRFDLPLYSLKDLVKRCDIWISVDSFLQHLAHTLGKPGIVIWSVSDPEIFGYKENINLLKDRKYLRLNQFDHWEAHSMIEAAFIGPDVIVECLEKAA